jgi:hypothetical protein
MVQKYGNMGPKNISQKRPIPRVPIGWYSSSLPWLVVIARSETEGFSKIIALPVSMAIPMVLK